MRDEFIAAFDPIVAETEKMMALWGTMQEAANRAASVPTEEVALRNLILQAAESLQRKAGDLFQQEDVYNAWAERQNATLVTVPAKALPKTVQAWRMDFVKQAAQHFFDALRHRMQLSSAADG